MGTRNAYRYTCGSSSLEVHSGRTANPLRITAAAWQFLLLTDSATAMELMLLAQTLPMILCDVFHKEYSYHEYTIAGIPGDSL